MSQGGKLNAEYQLPAGVLAALRQKPSTNQRPVSVQRSIVISSKYSTNEINPLSRSHQNLHTMGRTKLSVDTEERTVLRLRVNERLQDGASAGKFIKHRASQSTSDYDRSRVTQFDTSVTSQKLAEQVAVVARNPLMTSFNSSSMVKSQGSFGNKAPKYTGTRFGYLMNDNTTSREANNSPHSSSGHQTPKANPIETCRLAVGGKSVSTVVRRVAEDIESEGLLRTEIVAGDGQRFDSNSYLTKSIGHLKKLAKRYREEIEQVSRVMTELQQLIQKAKLEKLQQADKRDSLEQKKFEVDDIEFIREARLKELDRVKKKLCNSILDSNKGASGGYLTQSGLLQRSILPDLEIIAMKCSVYMVEKNDLECQLLLQRYQLLQSGFKTKSSD